MIPKTHFTQNAPCSLFCRSASHVHVSTKYRIKMLTWVVQTCYDVIFILKAGSSLNGISHRCTWEIPEPAPSLFQHGAQIGGSLGFSRNQNNRGLSGGYVTCIYCGLSVKMNMCKMLHGAQRSWMHLYCIICFCVVAKNPKTPIWTPWLTTPLNGWYRRSEISSVYLWDKYKQA